MYHLIQKYCLQKKHLCHHLGFTEAILEYKKYGHTINGCHHLLLTKYAHFAQPLQIIGLQKLYKLVLGLSGPENPGGTACLCSGTDPDRVP